MGKASLENTENAPRIQRKRTAEPGCFKLHFDELLAQFPNLKLLTGDVIFAQRPLVRALKDKVDCVFQVKENREGVLEAVKETFKDRKSVTLAAQKSSKKRLRRKTRTLDELDQCGLDSRQTKNPKTTQIYKINET